MRCALREWDKALRLAETLAPEQTPHICLQVELVGLVSAIACVRV